MSENEIAALDGDWSEFTPAERAAFAWARKLTYEPHRISDTDLDQLRKYYTDLQILEMTLSIAGNNVANRWKEGIGVPQEREHTRFANRPGVAGKPLPTDRPLPTKSFLTPTSEQYANKVTRVAPLVNDEKTSELTRLTVDRRSPLESRAEVERALEACQNRGPRLPLVGDDEAHALLPETLPAGPLPQWVRLLANFPRLGKSSIASLWAANESGDLSPLLKAQVSWIIARQDRAWYALGESKRRLNQLGWSDDQIYQLDGLWEEFTTADRAMFTLARKLAATPMVLTDQDVAEAVKLVGPRHVVQLVSYTAARSSFDRITEAAGLQLEENPNE